MRQGEKWKGILRAKLVKLKALKKKAKRAKAERELSDSGPARVGGSDTAWHSVIATQAKDVGSFWESLWGKEGPYCQSHLLRGWKRKVKQDRRERGGGCQKYWIRMWRGLEL